MIVLGFSSIAVICDLLSLHAPCSTLISSLRGRVYHVSSLIGASFMGNFNACTRLLQLKSLLHFSLLLKQTCVFLIINMATKVLKHLNIWKLSLLYNPSMQSSAFSMVQRKQYLILFTFVFHVQNLCRNAVTWQRQSASGDGSVSQCSKKLQWITFTPPEVMIFWQ